MRPNKKEILDELKALNALELIKLKEINGTTNEHSFDKKALYSQTIQKKRKFDLYRVPVAAALIILVGTALYINKYRIQHTSHMDTLSEQDIQAYLIGYEEKTKEQIPGLDNVSTEEIINTLNSYESDWDEI